MTWLTPAGWTALGAAVLLYAASLALGSVDLAVLAAGCALMVLAGLTWTLPMPRLRVSREIAPARVERGNAAVAVLTLVNAGRRRLAGVRALDTCAGAAVPIDIPALPPGGQRTVTYRLATERRGQVTVGPLRLGREDALALARRERSCGERRTLLVRPRVHALPMPPVGRTRHLEDSNADAPSGTVTFNALREYVPGDDLRHVHWRSSARTGALMMRQLTDAGRPRTTIVLDLRPDAYPGDELFELAVDAAASVAVAASGRSHPVRLVTTAGPLLETRGGRQDAGTLLDRLALVVPDAAGSLGGAFGGLSRWRGGGLLVAVTGRPEPSDLAGVHALRRRFERTVVVCMAEEIGGPGGEPAGAGRIYATSAEDLVSGWRREATR